MLSSRCEIILTSMKGGNYLSVTTKLVSTWLNCSEPSALNVISKMAKFEILKKEGGASKTVYVISDACSNNLLAASVNGNLTAAVKKTVDFFLNHHSPTSVVTTSNGRRFVKVESRKELSTESQHAVDNLLKILKDNEDLLKDNEGLRAENELLREKINNLQKYKEYYQSVKEIKL